MSDSLITATIETGRSAVQVGFEYCDLYRIRTNGRVLGGIYLKEHQFVPGVVNEALEVVYRQAGFPIYYAQHQIKFPSLEATVSEHAIKLIFNVWEIYSVAERKTSAALVLDKDKTADERAVPSFVWHGAMQIQTASPTIQGLPLEFILYFH